MISRVLKRVLADCNLIGIFVVGGVDESQRKELNVEFCYAHSITGWSIILIAA